MRIVAAVVVAMAVMAVRAARAVRAVRAAMVEKRKKYQAVDMLLFHQAPRQWVIFPL
jgi:hypothetical protein